MLGHLSVWIGRFGICERKKMAATIKNSRSDLKDKKITLIDRVDGFDSDVLAAEILPKEDGFISINDDRYIYYLFSTVSMR